MIILGSASDRKIAEKAIKILEKLQIPYSLKVASAHRTHDKVKGLVIDGTKEGVEVFIAIAGLAAHLPGAIAAYTHRPVIGVPVDGAIVGLDALYACVQMPYPIAVPTVGINRGDNAAILAGQIIASHDEKVKENISKLREEYQQKVENGEKDHLDKDFLKDKAYEKPGYVEPLENTPDVMILAGSHSDSAIAQKTAVLLERMHVNYQLDYISPVRDVGAFEEYMAKRANAKVFIAISGLSSVVAGSIVALSEKPVIGVPCEKKLSGQDALYSMVNMPPGMPIGTVGIDNGKNAAIVAGEILSLTDKNVEERLKWIRSKSGDL